MVDAHQFYVTPSEAHGEKGVSEPACACAVQVMAKRSSEHVVAQRSGLKGHVDDQFVVLQLHEEDRVHHARYLARG